MNFALLANFDRKENLKHNGSPEAALQLAGISVTYSFNCNVLQHNHKLINVWVDLNTALHITDGDNEKYRRKQNGI